MDDYYDILGVDKQASQNDIKKAYRKVAMKFHPDRNPGDKSAETRFKEAAEAYSVLSDDQKRAQYDQFGHAGMNGSGFNAPHFTDINDIFSSFSDIFQAAGFSDFFGGGSRGGRGRQTGGDLKISINVSLEEIYSGNEKNIKIKRLEPCEPCTGLGAKPGSKPIRCPACDGSGEVRRMQRSLFGQVINVQACRQCQGKGQVISDPCRTCSGNGLVKKSSPITIEIPPGVSSGNYMTKQGEGNKGQSGTPPGDLIIYFEESEHTLFSRDVNDIYLDAFVPFSKAVFGGQVNVPTLGGKVRLKIPSGIRPGQLLRLRGKGLPELNSHRAGDLFVRINISVPKKINSKTKKLLQELEMELSEDAEYKKFNG